MKCLRFAATVAATALALGGQGTETKRAAGDFPTHASLSDAELGAEFMVRLISLGRESFVTDNFLVVEVALVPLPGKSIVVRTNSFSLRINGKKDVLFAQPPGTVSASVKYPDWEWYRGGEVTAGNGDRSIGMGPPAPVERFPGDPRARRMPLPGGGAGQENTPAQETRLSPTEVINRSALPEGPRKTPVSGYLFFPWRGNPTKLKIVELTVTDETSGPVTLRLR